MCKTTASAGAYFKAEAARVGGPLFTPGEVEVGTERWAICDHHQKLNGDLRREHKQEIIDLYKKG
jgi:hypothetical protein